MTVIKLIKIFIEILNNEFKYLIDAIMPGIIFDSLVIHVYNSTRIPPISLLRFINVFCSITNTYRSYKRKMLMLVSCYQINNNFHIR